MTAAQMLGRLPVEHLTDCSHVSEAGGKSNRLTMEAHHDLGRLAHESAFELQAGAQPQSPPPHLSSGVPSVHLEGDPWSDTYSIQSCLPDETEKGAEGRLDPSERLGVGLSGLLNVKKYVKIQMLPFYAPRK